jgi:hypothetical protein
MHNISNLFYFGTTLYMFRTVSPSIIRSLKLYIQLASKQPQDLPDFSVTLNFLDRISKNTQTLNFKKICSMEAELFYADTRTDGQTWRS